MSKRAKMDKLIEDMVSKIEQLWIIANVHRSRIAALEKAKEDEEDDERRFYEAWLNCSNCRVAVRVKISRGTTVTQYRREAKHRCPKCGCKFAKD